MKSNILIPVLLLLVINAVTAVPISYDITVNGVTGDNIPYSLIKNEVRDCEKKCTYQIPEFDIPQDFTLSDYTISNPSELIKTIGFESNDELVTATLTDSLIIEIIELKEELGIGRLVTKTLNLGQNNLVLEVKNIGNKDISDIYVKISGDGVKTTSVSKINLLIGQSDFVSTIVSIENYGDVDIIIKAFSNETLLGQTIESIYINPPVIINEPVQEFVDPDYAKQEIDLLWNTVIEYEKDYFIKVSEEYDITDFTSAFNELKDGIAQLELDYQGLTKEEFDKIKSIISRNLNDIKIQLEFAKPKKFTDTIRENLGLIATTIGVIVSSLTAFGLAKSHLLGGGHKGKDIRAKKESFGVIKKKLR